MIETSSKLSKAITATLPVMEAFYTVQGEGFHHGKPAYFVRLGGCDVGCFWCDVKESWDVLNHPQKTTKQIIEEAKADIHRQLSVTYQRQTPAICVVTGGEPLIHDLSQLTVALQQTGFQTHLETSGAYHLSGSWNWVCLSPKKFKPPVSQIFQKANELKMVVYNKDDFKWAEQNAANVSPECQLYLQPEWSKCETIAPLIVNYIKSHPQWQLSLQIHKYIHIP